MITPTPRILVLAGSERDGTAEHRLAAVAARELALGGADVTLAALADYPLPTFGGHGDRPANAGRLAGQIGAHDGLLLIASDTRSGLAAGLRNALEWVAQTPGAPIFRHRPCAIGVVGRGSRTGLSAAAELRLLLGGAFGALVMGGEIAVADPGDAFDEAGRLTQPAVEVEMQRFLRDFQRLCRAHALFEDRP